MSVASPTHHVEVTGPPGERFEEILTPGALDFIGRLDAAFSARRTALLAERRRRALRLASGCALDFSVATRAVREDSGWRVAGPAPGLTDRRVEITGPPQPRMAVNALNSGARVWMADFEDATSPRWENVVGGQLTLLDAIERRLDFTRNGKRYRVDGRPATIMVRPRGWHLTEDHLLVDGRPVAAPLVDFGLYFFHCARRQTEAGSGPYFYLPKLENHYEARLWNDIFVFAQDLLGIPRGTVRATVLIETVTAAFEMEEILYELREHSAGLNAGRWDYLFNLIKNFAHRPDFVLPDRAKVTMTAPFLRAYTELLVRTCHRRGAHAIGGMAAQIPGGDAESYEAALARVRLDKEREAEDGFDGSWVAHPALVPVCADTFGSVLGERPHQIERTRDDVEVGAADLLAVRRTGGAPTPEGIRGNIAVALRYFDAWLRGQGAVALYGLMEDAATAEIARCQIWQWQQHGAVSRETVLRLLDEESAALAKEDPSALSAEAREIFVRTALAGELPGFFTADAYERHLVRRVTDVTEEAGVTEKARVTEGAGR
ncbi:malate synthase [Streptomyces sp. Amel2xB2]|uniref:malate synthase A n=1 Tax=Streptomyces sp. Amel2xB2 TaxID=1305829 RepID=UPI000DBA2F40|nr:malate synthase A [Streptomyces sp. Amel2xB2]RAJ71269.1 malate synthase [Streptomyces sp. Amel2xB2]